MECHFISLLNCRILRSRVEKVEGLWVGALEALAVGAFEVVVIDGGVDVALIAQEIDRVVHVATIHAPANLKLKPAVFDWEMMPTVI